MITNVKDKFGYKNEITRYLDNYLIDECDDFSSYCTYIYEKPRNNFWAIRVPGATRGHVEVDSNIIKNIVLYEDNYCYRKEVFNNLNQFIGKEVDFSTL